MTWPCEPGTRFVTVHVSRQASRIKACSTWGIRWPLREDLEHYVWSYDDFTWSTMFARMMFFFVSSLARSVNFLGSSLLRLSTWISRMVQRSIDVTTRMVQRFFDVTIRMVQRFIDVTIHSRKQASWIKAYHPRKLTTVKGRWYGHRGIRIISEIYKKWDVTSLGSWPRRRSPQSSSRLVRHGAEWSRVVVSRLDNFLSPDVVEHLDIVRVVPSWHFGVVG